MSTLNQYKDKYLSNYNYQEVFQIPDGIDNVDMMQLLMDIFEKLKDLVTPIYSLNMDIYTISRMFVQYSLRSDEYNQGDAYRVVVYAGYGHNYNYLKFLMQYIKADLIYEEPETYDYRCLHIDNRTLDQFERFFDPYLYRQYYLQKYYQVI